MRERGGKIEGRQRRERSKGKESEGGKKKKKGERNVTWLTV